MGIYRHETGTCGAWSKVAFRHGSNMLVIGTEECSFDVLFVFSSGGICKSIDCIDARLIGTRFCKFITPPSIKNKKRV